MREQHGLSTHDLAAAAGVTQARVVALEDGRLDPDFELLVKLAESMGTHPAAFALRARELGDQDAEGRA